MKKLIGLLFISFVTFEIFAQDSTYIKVKEPDFQFEPVLLNSDLTTTAIPLEKAEITGDSKMKKSEFSYVLKTPRSTFVLKEQPLKIVVKHGPVLGMFINPRDYYKLFKMTVDEKKGTRTCVYFRQTYTGTGKPTTDNTSLYITMTVSKIRDEIYLLVSDNLEPGEYAISVGEKLFTFRIE